MTSRAKQALVGTLAAVMLGLMATGDASANWGPRTRWQCVQLSGGGRLWWQQPKKAAGHVPRYFYWTWGTGVLGTPDNGPGQTATRWGEKPIGPLGHGLLQLPSTLPKKPKVVKVDKDGVAKVKTQMTTEGQKELDKLFKQFGVKTTPAPSGPPTTMPPAIMPPSTMPPATMPMTPPTETGTVNVDEAGVQRVRAQMTPRGQQKLNEVFRAFGVRPSNAPPP